MTTLLLQQNLGFAWGDLANSGSDVQSSGGGWLFYTYYEDFLSRKTKKQKELDDKEEYVQELQDKIDREIAQLLIEQQRKNEERADLDRLRTLVVKYRNVAPVDINSERVLAAISDAKQRLTRASLEKLQREFNRMIEEEEHAVLLLILNA